MYMGTFILVSTFVNLYFAELNSYVFGLVGLQLVRVGSAACRTGDAVSVMCSHSASGGGLPPADDRNLFHKITRPPKPPSWRDFQTDTKDSSPPKKSERRPKELIGFSSLSLTHRSRSEGTDISRLGVASSSTVLAENRAATLPHLKQHRKQKNRLHRTRSQYNIEKADLPEKSQMTVSLADTKPQELGLRSKRPIDAMTYMNENTRRCEKWLAGVRASQPAFTQDIGIPEENSSSDQDSAKSRAADKTSSSDVESATSKSKIPVSAPSHRGKVKSAKQLTDEQLCAQFLSERRLSLERVIADTLKRRSGSFENKPSNGVTEDAQEEGKQ
ncbi:hypothetical protein CAPTEDRAFT_191690 [Capitella teleta]|uniref:Uncharacterized protein n=1 Tax=Capitella teleta TaxID=283909 RepID=R7VD61_CAPTE|nr:hypothetical protein CAPTEDRAFT_191690 [Capitella teleta]|eukprot:ELU14221.1 hypothetical protein CAPTEDRAFT_191690 [Capitella teleta]